MTMGDSIVLLYVFVSLLVLAAAVLGFCLGYLLFVDRHRDLLTSSAATDQMPSRRDIAISYMISAGYREISVGQHERHNTDNWQEAETFADRFLRQITALQHTVKKGA